jgi:Fe-S cluster biogenesis protein NfuA/nitrite reductase/ring-hydroxylating ferredoxin subunit
MTPAAHEVTDADAAPDSDLRAAGERIEMLLDASSAHGAMARERSEELVRLVADLYGAGLGRILDIVHDAGHLDGSVLDALAADDLVASLLLVHGLHPYDVGTRIERALDEVRPYLGTHGGDVELLGVTEAGVVRLRLLGSCDGCASSSVTLKLAVEGAVEAAAPEITGIEVDTGGSDGATGTVIPLSALRVRLDELDAAEGGGEAAGSAWHGVPELAEVADGEVRGLVVADVAVIVARVGADLFAYRDGCPVCTGGLGGTALARRLGGAVGEAVLRCPACRSHFDVRRAGAGLDGDGHLEPLPLLVHDDVVSLALPTAGPVRA